MSNTSVKLERDAHFACQLLANHYQGRPIRRIVEDAVKAHAAAVLRYGPGHRQWDDLWDEVEAVRELRKLTAEGYHLDKDGLTKRRFLRAHWWLFFGEEACLNPRLSTADLLYPKLESYVLAWRETAERDVSDQIAKDLRAANLPVPKRS